MTIQYDPQKVTDWLTPLEKVYARQSRQLDTYQAQLRERDRQEEAATINLPEIFQKLASFSQSIASLKQAKERKKAEQKADEQAKWEIERIKKIQDPDKVKESVERLVEMDALKLDRTQYLEQLRTMGLSDIDFEYMASLHGGGLLKEREFLAHQFTKNLDSNFRANLLQNPEANLKWQKNERNPEARALQRKQFALDSYKKLGFTKKEFIADNFWKEIDRKVNTAQTLENIKASKTVLTERSIKIDSDIDVARGQLINDESALTKQMQLHIKEGVDPSRGITVEDSKENYTVRLERLASTGDFTEEELRLIRTGQLPIPHAAGKTGEIILKPEQWQRIQKSINTYNAGQVSLRNESIKAGATNTIAALYKGDLPIEQAQQIKDDALLNIRTTLGEQSEAYKALDAVDPSAQIEGAYETAKAKYTEIFNGNDPSKVLQIEKDIDLETNGRVKAELQEIVEETKATLRAANLPDTWSGYLDTIKGDMLTDSALAKGLDRDTVLSDNQERVQLFIAKKKLNTLLAASRAGESVETANKVHRGWLDENGFSVVDTANATGVGMLSPDAEGIYQRFEFIQDAKIENTIKPSKYQMGLWSIRGQKARQKAKGNIEEMLNTAEAYIDKEDALGAFIEPSQTDEFQLFYSPELITKSLAIGKQPGYVLKKSIEALIANPDYKDYVNKFKLKEKLKILEDAPDLKLKDIIDKLGDRDLITQYNYRGIMSFTPKQLTRLMNLEIASNIPIVEN
tara:strand:+ start:361 stop:2592 length:2232 start_codon:yes stop_codon:yes gene_type:complete